MKLKTITAAKRDIDSLFKQSEILRSRIEKMISEDSDFLKIQKEARVKDFRFIFYPHSLEFGYYHVTKRENQKDKTKDIFNINCFNELEFFVIETPEIKQLASKIQEIISKFYEEEE